MLFNPVLYICVYKDSDMSDILSKTQNIRAHLLMGLPLTSLDMLKKYGCYRASSVIHRLRHDYFMNIETTMIEEGGVRYASYRLVDETRQ